ncbi:MAG TPA: Bax inhibitor-1/YccA family protein [Tepidisphaeraceae bacterium]|nr:Bax inhibitor-1/YccA family protein [Tepidisphaeraceae bacterium]
MARFPQSPFGAGGGGFAGGETLPYRSKEQQVTLGQFFNAVYAWMAVGLALTAVVAFVVATYARSMMLNPGVLIISVIAQFALVITISRAINRINASVATGLFLVYAALNGVWLSVLFALYAHATLASTFMVTAGAFGATSLYGYTTKRDLTGLGSLLFMALIGLILASLVNLFFMNPMMQWLISYAGVLIFVGLTAYDTQNLKAIAFQTGDNPALAHRMAIVGSLRLYLDFINLFLFLLEIMSDRRR